MAQACIYIELSEGRWKTDVSRNHSDLSFQLLSVVLCGDSAVETVVVTGCNTGTCLADIDSHHDVGRFNVIEQHKDGAIVQLQTLEPTVPLSAARAGIPLLYPAEVSCGTLTVNVIGTHTAISSLGDQLHSSGIGFDVAYIQSDHHVGSVLTDRQKEVLFTAIEHGYYESPRQCTLTEVAEILGIAKSTCSGTLQRAEEAVVEYFCLQYHLSKQDIAGTRETPVSGNLSG